MAASIVDTGVKTLGLRFAWVSVVPASIPLVLGAALVASGAPGTRPDAAPFVRTFNALGTREALALLVGVVLVALFVQPLQRGFVRLLEGYGLPRPVAAVCTAHHRRRRATLRERSERHNVEPARLSERDRADMQAAAARLDRYYPRSDRVLPTMLGNVLRAAEDAPERRYGLDAVVLWPRLYPLLPDRMNSVLTDQRNQLDASAGFCFAFLASAVVSAGLLWEHDTWLVVPLVCAVLAWLAYRAAVAAALAYGETVQAAFDVYRFELLKALHLPLPPDPDAERRINTAVSMFLRQGLFADSHEPVRIQYVHSHPVTRAGDSGRQDADAPSDER